MQKSHLLGGSCAEVEWGEGVAQHPVCAALLAPGHLGMRPQLGWFQKVPQRAEQQQ